MLLLCEFTFAGPRPNLLQTTINSEAERKETERKEATTILNRLQQIYAMDKSKLSSRERGELRKEVKEDRNRLRILSGGIYLSVGAIIIIILLLILLL